jgi:iron complex transport system substrate-binding protein
MRIVSLLPSLTEICFALGLGNDLVAVTHECDYPSRARTLPFITKSILPPDLRDSAEIDRQVKAALEQGKALYKLDVEKLHDLRPHLILTQELCHVCAVSFDDVKAIAGQIEPAPEVVSIEPNTLEDVLESITRIGALTDRQETAAALVEALQTPLDLIREHVSRTDYRPRIVCLEWLDPPMVAGHWVPEMVQIAGGVDPLGRPGEASFEVTWQDVIDSQPDTMVLMPCGYGLADTVAETERLVDAGDRLPDHLDRIPAVREGHVYAVDGSGYFNRPGPRVIVGTEILAGILHAEMASSHIPPGTVEPVHLHAAGVQS